MYSPDQLRRVRYELPMWAVVAALDRDGPPSKVRDGRFVFLYPDCGDMLVAVNPRNNLAHCFGCARNFNNIDLLVACGHDLRSAVARLKDWLEQYRSERSGNRVEVAHHVAPARLRGNGAERVRSRYLPPRNGSQTRRRNCSYVHVY
jgi:hypothetical protein